MSTILTHAEARRIVFLAAEREAQRLGAEARAPEAATLLRIAARDAAAAADRALVLAAMEAECGGAARESLREAGGRLVYEARFPKTDFEKRNVCSWDQLAEHCREIWRRCYDAAALLVLGRVEDLVRGEVYHTHFRTWSYMADPKGGAPGNRFASDEVTRHSDRLADEIAALRPRQEASHG